MAAPPNNEFFLWGAAIILDCIYGGAGLAIAGGGGIARLFGEF